MTLSITQHDEIDTIRARARLLQLALAGSRSTGFCIDSGIYHDAVVQCAGEIAQALDDLIGSEQHHWPKADDKTAMGVQNKGKGNDRAYST